MTIEDRFKRRLWLYRGASAVCVIQMLVLNDTPAFLMTAAAVGVVGGWWLEKTKYASWKEYEDAEDSRLALMGRYERFPSFRSQWRGVELLLMISLFPYHWIALMACVVPLGVLGYLTRINWLLSKHVGQETKT